MPKNLKDPEIDELDIETIEDDDMFADDTNFGDDDDGDNDFLDVDPDALDDDLEPEDGEGDDDGEDGDDDEGDDEDDNSSDEVFALSDGTEVPVSDIEEAYTQRAELTVAQEALAADRAIVDETTESLRKRHSQLETQVNQLTEYLTGIIPPEPDRRLIDVDVAEFTRQEKHREAVIAEIQGVLAIKNQVAGQGQQMSQDDHARYVTAENAKLTAAMPTLRDQKRREAFEAENAKTAAELGFTEEEIANAGDHRIKLLVHYAGIGKKSLHNRKNAQRRVTKAKSARPTSTRRSNSATAKNIDKHRQAYRKTGSSVSAEAIALAAFED